VNWTRETVEPAERKWEDFYRNRWAHDKVVRTTHGVNCTGGCSWQVYVKNGVVSWEMQATDYPELEAGLPPYEPRGCQRGISFSWYLYSPLRIKYPYARGVLLDLWREARAGHADPVAAWRSIASDPEKRAAYQRARGKGGLRRASWDELLELLAAAQIHTIKKHGPDRIIGFSPIPAMSQVSYLAGSRYLSLLGGVVMSFYDWYADLPNASPQVWGEQTDVCESADWFNARYVAVVGSNISVTRTPDAHFVNEVRHAGAKVVVFSPDFSDTCKQADTWVPLHAGQDGPFWMAANHVILKEFHADRQVPYFADYVRRYTDAPTLVLLEPSGELVRPGRFLRAADVPALAGEENASWKPLVWDAASGGPRAPLGSVGHRWQKTKGQWNLGLKDASGADLDPEVSFLGRHDEVLQLEIEDYGERTVLGRGVPVRHVDTVRGRVPVTTVWDLMMAQFGVSRGLPGAYPESYDDAAAPFTPAWQEQFTGVSRNMVIRVAREFATNAEQTRGRSMFIIGAGANQWYHSDLIYRACITALMITGSVGRNGGGLNHYVGQEKVVPFASWAALAFARDWGMVPRHQNTPSFHYVHSDQWRYERQFGEYSRLPTGRESDASTRGHCIDQQARAVRLGWLPFNPHFDRSPLQVVAEAREDGATLDAAVVESIVRRLKDRSLRFAVEDPDAPSNWPRIWFIWRANALGSSAKGHEFFLKHYLGTHTGVIADEMAQDAVSEVRFRKDAPAGKFDLIVDLNFRMDTTALYSDVILPSATWYEKDDLNTTDLHSFIHPLQAAVPPVWESRSDWDIFNAIAEKVSELAGTHLPDPVKDLIAVPLEHDTPDEIAQERVLDWRRDECEAVPGKTMPHLRLVERDYTRIAERMKAVGPGLRANGLAAHGIRWSCEDLYDELAARRPRLVDGRVLPSIETAREVADTILQLAPESNGESAYRAFAAEEEKVGLPLVDLAAETRGSRIDFEQIAAQPRRMLTSPVWSGIVNHGRAYSAYTLNVERLVPWRTLTGRQSFYLDHDVVRSFGEALPTYKPNIDHAMLNLYEKSRAEADGLLLNYITPHGKWSIHTTFSDNHRMMTLSRGGCPVWVNERDAAQLGIGDNDWVEVFNDNGVIVARAVVSARIPRGIAMIYHATERTVGVPRSSRGGQRGGMHNSVTRVHLKPSLMAGGYAQFTYALNYWGPTGVNRDSYVFLRRVERPEW
jgi:nitrate reductase alpha subunit